jgi:serine/threonine protein kinase
MMEMDELRRAFPDLSDIRPLNVTGGQKQVFRAVNGAEAVALKVIRRYAGDGSRTEREIAAVSKLSSSYVPAIRDCGVKRIGGEDRYFIVEQFIEGRSYREVLRDRPVRTLTECLDICRSLLGGCEDFERARLVHRDIKPENLMFGVDGKLWVVDFGLARHLDLSSVTLTEQHFGVGTWGYMAPEQFRNLKPQIDGRADLYSVGIVLHESSAGRHPFIKSGMNVPDLIRRIENEDAAQLTDAGDPDGLFGDFVSQLVQRFPSRRPQSAAEAREWFEPIYRKLGGTQAGA